MDLIEKRCVLPATENKISSFEVRYPRCVCSITTNFCVLHIQCSTVCVIRRNSLLKISSVRYVCELWLLCSTLCVIHRNSLFKISSVRYVLRIVIAVSFIYFIFLYFRNTDVTIITLTDITSDVSMCYFAKVVRSYNINFATRPGDCECTVLKFVNKTHVQGNRKWFVLLIV